VGRHLQCQSEPGEAAADDENVETQHDFHS
jgi:hypothetical protein